jgi:hypothetical protein
VASFSRVSLIFTGIPTSAFFIGGASEGFRDAFLAQGLCNAAKAFWT